MLIKSRRVSLGNSVLNFARTWTYPKQISAKWVTEFARPGLSFSLFSSLLCTKEQDVSHRTMALKQQTILDKEETMKALTMKVLFAADHWQEDVRT